MFGLRLFSVLLICAALIFAAYRFYESRTLIPLNLEKVESKIKFNKIIEDPIMDVFFNDFTGDGHVDLVVTRLGGASSNKANSTPVHMIESKNGEWVEVSVSRYKPVSTVHARHVSFFDINNDGYKDFVISDHGMDKPPFSGGFSQIILSQKENNQLSWHSQKLSTQKAFNFFSCFINIDNDKIPEIFQASMHSIDQSHVFKWDQKIHELKNWFSGKNDPNSCWMSCFAGKILKEENLILGSCDRAGARDEDSFDKLLVKNPSGSLEQTEILLGPRPGGKTFGTVDIKSGDFDGDGLEDIVVSTHNPGNRLAKIGIYHQLTNTSFEVYELPIVVSGDFFIPWLSVADINHDGYSDILALVRPLSTPTDARLVRLFLGNPRFGKLDFQEYSNPEFDSAVRNPVAASFAQEGVNTDIIILDYSGRVVRFRKK